MADESAAVTKLEQRAWATVVGIVLLLGGWWLQNQYDTVLRLQQQVEQYMRFVDDKYVQKDYLDIIVDRLERIEGKLDNVNDRLPVNPHFGDKPGPK
jgi:hypothetical protein